jgi:hypothetical protein
VKTFTSDGVSWTAMIHAVTRMQLSETGEVLAAGSERIELVSELGEKRYVTRGTGWFELVSEAGLLAALRDSLPD